MMNKKQQQNHLPLWQNPRFRYSSLSTAVLCLFLAVLVALNVLATSLEKKNGWRMDFSFNALTTHSQATLDILSGMEHPVHIYALYTRGQEDQPLVELLDRYSAASSLVTWEQADISLRPDLLEKFGETAALNGTSIANDSLIVYCEDTGRSRVLDARDFISLSYDAATGQYSYYGLKYESSLTSAISYVTQDTIPRVLLMQGHGELSEEESMGLADLLSRNNYDVYYFTLGTPEVTLGENDLLAILSPRRDLTAEELDTVLAFVRQGGSLLFSFDYDQSTQKMPNLMALLRSYGFLPLEGMVVASGEESGTYYNNNRTFLVPVMQSTEITADLVAGHNTTLFMPGSRAFEMPTTADQHLTVIPVLTTGEKAFLRSTSKGKFSLNKEADDKTGPFALALMASRITEEGYMSRAFVIGCSSLLTSQEAYTMTVSQEFTIRTAEYLLNNSPVDLNIMAKVGLRPQLSTASISLGSMVLVALPTAIIAVAVIVLGNRRGRKE